MMRDPARAAILDFGLLDIRSLAGRNLLAGSIQNLKSKIENQMGMGTNQRDWCLNHWKIENFLTRREGE